MRVITLASCALERKRMIAKMLSIGTALPNGGYNISVEGMGDESTICYKWGDRTATVIIKEVDYIESMRETLNLTAQDVVYAAEYKNSGGHSHIYKENIEWLKTFIDTRAVLCADKSQPGTRIKDVDGGSPSVWATHIDQMFGIVNPIITSVSLFQKAPLAQVGLVKKLPQLPAQVRDTPWPLPEMTIMVPQGVIVESMCYDAGAGAIKIVFG